MTARRSFVLFLTLTLFSIMSFAKAGEFADRRALKKMCKSQYKQCREEKPRKVCKQEKKQCRRENGVSLGDDLKFLFGKAKDVVKKVLGKVQIERAEDEEFGYYTKISVEATYLKLAPGFTVKHNDFQSFVTLPHDAEVKKLEFYLYDSDLKIDNYVMALQTSPGRKFPKFFDGRVFDSLLGVQYVSQKGKAYQFYFDGSHDIFGSFLPSKTVGHAINALNYVKNYFPYVSSLVPDVNYVPINLKYKGTKIGRASFLSKKSFENSSGVLVLFDHAVIAATF